MGEWRFSAARCFGVKKWLPKPTETYRNLPKATETCRHPRAFGPESGSDKLRGPSRERSRAGVEGQKSGQRDGITRRSHYVGLLGRDEACVG